MRKGWGSEAEAEAPPVVGSTHGRGLARPVMEEWSISIILSEYRPAEERATPTILLR